MCMERRPHAQGQRWEPFPLLYTSHPGQHLGSASQVFRTVIFCFHGVKAVLARAALSFLSLFFHIYIYVCVNKKSIT